MTVTERDVIDQAVAVIDGITSGSLKPTEVERQAVAACRALFGIVSGESDDPLRELHIDTTRQSLAAGLLSADEIAEWLSAARRREGRESDVSGAESPALPELPE